MPRSIRVRPADPHRALRGVAKAEELLAGAHRAAGVGDRTLAMIAYCHAAIHASDALCAIATGTVPADADHAQAAGLLARVPDGARLAAQLRRVIAVKKRWSYEADDIGATELRALARAAESLVGEAGRRARG